MTCAKAVSPQLLLFPPFLKLKEMNKVDRGYDLKRIFEKYVLSTIQDGEPFQGITFTHKNETQCEFVLQLGQAYVHRVNDSASLVKI